MIKILLKTIIDLVKIVYDVIILAFHICFKLIKMILQILSWLVKTLAKIIKRNREERAIIKYFSYNEYHGEKIPYLNGQNKPDKQDKKSSFFTKIKNKILKKTENKNQ